MKLPLVAAVAIAGSCPSGAFVPSATKISARTTRSGNRAPQDSIPVSSSAAASGREAAPTRSRWSTRRKSRGLQMKSQATPVKTEVRSSIASADRCDPQGTCQTLLQQCALIQGNRGHPCPVAVRSTTSPEFLELVDSRTSSETYIAVEEVMYS